MNAIILAAGYATRLYPMTKDCPKALLSINGRPIIDFIMEKLSLIPDLEDVFVVTNNKFISLFVRWLESQKPRFNIKIINDKTSSEKDRLGAIGDLSFVIKKGKINSDLLIIAGDNLFDFTLEEFIRSSQKTQHVSVGIYDIENLDQADKFGVVKIGRNNNLVEFVEKPKIPFSSLIAVGIYFMPRETLKFINEYLSSTGSPDALGNYIKWLMDRDRVRGYKFKGVWYDIGDIDTYKKACINFRA